MALHGSYDAFRAPARGKRCPGKAAAHGRFHPRLELLEDRVTPSVLTVTTNADSGAGSLRAALAASHAGETIRFASSLAGQTIHLTSGELAITHNLKIRGPRASQLTIDGDGMSRIFDISGASNVQISGVTLADGLAGAGATQPGEGGAIYDSSGHLMLRNDVLTGDSAQGGVGAAGEGGAIYFAGKDLMIFNTVFSKDLAQGGAGANAATAGGVGGAGGAGAGGAIYNTTDHLLLDSDTFANNQAIGGAGGMGGAGTAARSASPAPTAARAAPAVPRGAVPSITRATTSS